ncbi:TatD family hydrolase [Patescibacteria group bacterium]|nr:TatD family hydrolase [Patescibacteria group bacterium]MBU1029431.1 TatD family hydrolase [Patescibacteria group bacterium]MBU1915786.1 TatD family hydrolase [Patescibacteria group bacterium]
MPTTCLIDTHAHLDDSVYKQDLDIVIRQAVNEGVWIITVGNDYETSIQAVKIAEKYPNVYASIGFHPLKIGGTLQAEDKLVDVGRYIELARHPKVVALGETGLDFHDLPQGRKKSNEYQLAERIKDNQRKVFAWFLEMSRELRLPLLLHCRDAHDEMLKLLETWDRATSGFDARGVIHCFSGNWKQARRYFNLDFMISVTGIISHGGYQGELLKKAPLSRLLAESDCPYSTPTPWSIRRNEPAYIKQVAANLASLRKISVIEVEQQLSANAKKVFKRIKV